ncbi:MAG: hypothetical protein ACLU4J_16590 [Butyricimonas paravirosa]
MTQELFKRRLFGTNAGARVDDARPLTSDGLRVATTSVTNLDESATYYYQMVLRIRDLLESKMKSFDAEDLPHYEAMLFAMKQMLGKQAQTK